ncbi:hypothetical protein Salat_1888800, partial [Sesamum alatum]
MSVHYGGNIVESDYAGGSTYKFDHVDYKLVGIGGWNGLSNYVGIKGEKKYFSKHENIFQSISSNSALQDLFAKLDDNGEVDIYKNREVVAEEVEDFDGDMLHGGVNNYVSSSGGEDFDGSDREYEYKRDEEKDEEEERAGDAWGVEGDIVENIVKKAKDEKMGEGRVEDTNVKGTRVSDTDGEE